MKTCIGFLGELNCCVNFFLIFGLHIFMAGFAHVTSPGSLQYSALTVAELVWQMFVSAQELSVPSFEIASCSNCFPNTLL